MAEWKWKGGCVSFRGLWTERAPGEAKINWELQTKSQYTGGGFGLSQQESHWQSNEFNPCRYWIMNEILHALGNTAGDGSGTGIGSGTCSFSTCGWRSSWCLHSPMVGSGLSHQMLSPLDHNTCWIGFGGESGKNQRPPEIYDIVYHFWYLQALSILFYPMLVYRCMCLMKCFL